MRDGHQVNETMSNIEKLFQHGEHMWIMTEERDPHGFFSEMKTAYEVGHCSLSHRSHYRCYCAVEP